MADRIERAATTAALDRNRPQTWPAGARVADHGAWMPTRQYLATWLRTVWNGIFARGSRGEALDLGQWGLPAWTTEHHVRRSGAVRRIGVLRMAALLAEVDTAVERTVADLSATERTDPRFWSI